MILIRILSGPYAGEERMIEDGQYAGHEINPSVLLGELVHIGSVWGIDYSHASDEEKLVWGRADLAARISRALLEGRPVHFQGQTYQARSESEAAELAGEIEDAIVYSGRYVVVAHDDENGVLIETGAREHPLQ